MTTKTRVSFVVGSGRCGTYSLYKAMVGLPNVEARHEPWCEAVQQLGCLRHADMLSDTPLKASLERLHGDAVHYSRTDHWVCIGNKESWLVRPLFDVFPRARFVWLVRDGRKVCLSYYHKLAAEHYDDEAVKALTDYFSFPAEDRPPPLDKRWWWPVPKTDSERSEFVRWDRWRRVCWHFNEICRELKGTMTVARMKAFRLEDMVQDAPNGGLKEFKRMTYRMGLDGVDSASLTGAWQTFRKPSNVHVPINFEMTPELEAVYREMCGEVHEWLGYDWEEPEEVKYDEY